MQLLLPNIFTLSFILSFIFRQIPGLMQIAQLWIIPLISRFWIIHLVTPGVQRHTGGFLPKVQVVQLIFEIPLRSTLIPLVIDLAVVIEGEIVIAVVIEGRIVIALVVA